MRKTLISTSLTLLITFGAFASSGKDHFTVTVTDTQNSTLHNIDIDVADEDGTAILSTDSGKIIGYQMYSLSHHHLSFHDLNSGKYKICFKSASSTIWKTIVIP